jgi:hypothetical protein
MNFCRVGDGAMRVCLWLRGDHDWLLHAFEAGWACSREALIPPSCSISYLMQPERDFFEVLIRKSLISKLFM